MNLVALVLEIASFVSPAKIIPSVCNMLKVSTPNRRNEAILEWENMNKTSQINNLTKKMDNINIHILQKLLGS